MSVDRDYYEKKNGKRKVQGVPKSQTAALPRHQEEEETNIKPNKRKSYKRTKSTKTSSLFKATKSKTNTGITALERVVK